MGVSCGAGGVSQQHGAHEGAGGIREWRGFKRGQYAAKALRVRAPAAAPAVCRWTEGGITCGGLRTEGGGAGRDGCMGEGRRRGLPSAVGSEDRGELAG